MTETATPPGSLSLLEAMSRENSRRLLQREAASTAALLSDWQVVERRALADLAALQEQIDAARAAGRTVSPAWLYQQERLGGLLGTVEQQVQAYGGKAAAETVEGQAWAQSRAAGDAGAMLRVDTFGVNPANVGTLAGFLVDGSPVADLFAGMGALAAGEARMVLTQAVAFGWGADKTARALTASLGVHRARAETIARTELHRVYRTTTRDTYQANSDVVRGWMWRAALDARTCPGCRAMDGTVHPVDEVLAGHPRCRCAMIPLTPSWADLGLSGVTDTGVTPYARGRDSLEAMTPAEQDATLGRTKAALYRQGSLTLDDMVTRVDSSRWGPTYREATIAEARANAVARGTAQRVSKRVPATSSTPARRKTPAEVRSEAAAIREAVPDARAELARRKAQAAALTDSTPGPSVQTFGGRVDAKTLKARIAEGDWRYVDDRSKRAAVLLQNDYRAEQAVKKMAANLREGRDAQAGVGVPRAWSKTYTGHVTDVGVRYTEQNVRDALEDAARWLVDQDEVTPRVLYKGLDVPKDRIARLFQEGASFDTNYSSFTTDEAVARRYSSRRATAQVVVRARQTSAVKVQGNPTAEHWKTTKEHLVTGQGRVVKVVDDGRTVWVDVEF